MNGPNEFEVTKKAHVTVSLTLQDSQNEIDDEKDEADTPRSVN